MEESKKNPGEYKTKLRNYSQTLCMNRLSNEDIEAGTRLNSGGDEIYTGQNIDEEEGPPYEGSKG